MSFLLNFSFIWRYKIDLWLEKDKKRKKKVVPLNPSTDIFNKNSKLIFINKKIFIYSQSGDFTMILNSKNRDTHSNISLFLNK